MRISFNANPLTLDPRKNSDLVTSTVLFMLYEGLTKMFPNGEIALRLAERYEISEDLKTYTFYLKKAKWSDGTPITAYDFEYSWKSQLDPQFPSPCKYLLYPIRNAEKVSKGELPISSLGIHALDDLRFVVELEHPTPFFLSVTSFCNLYPLPKHILEKDPQWETKETFTTSGPFLLKKWNRNQELSFVKNPSYWDAAHVSLDALHASIITDEHTALQMFENDELDWIGTPISPIPQEAIHALHDKNTLKYHPIAGTIFLTYNLHHSFLQNKNLRAAFTLAMNRDEIIKNVTKQKEIIATRPLPPALMDNQNKILVKDHDLEHAQEFFKKGLEELHIEAKDLETVRLIYRSPSQRNLAQALQNQWQKAFGITIKIEAYDQKILIDKLEKQDFDIAFSYWIAQVNDPMNILDRFKFSSSPKNYPRWEDQEYIHLLDTTYLAKTKEERFHLIEEAEKRFCMDFPVAPIYHFNYATLSKPYVQGVRICPIGSIQFYHASLSRIAAQE